MEAVEKFSAEKLFRNILKANKKNSENYLENFLRYHRDAHDIALTYCYFFTKLFAEPSEVIMVQNYSGKQIPLSKVLGNKKYKEVEPAPGSYVKEKC
ncbi:MAG TPA: hypothetical protein VNX01_04475 [Bacteroidia bacterium]|jgi:hypothetical protein|nr:hypothetical protein [Bacteroidia bacterium]